jgi:hypothetical protein
MNSCLFRIFLASAALLMIACTTSGQHAGQAPAAEASHARAEAPYTSCITQTIPSPRPSRSGFLIVGQRSGSPRCCRRHDRQALLPARDHSLRS